MRIRELILKPIIILITILFLSVSCAGNKNLHDKEITNIEVEPIEDFPRSEIPEKELPIEKSHLNFKKENGLELKVSNMEDISFGYLHTGLYSPEGHVVLENEEIDHGIQTLALRTFGEILTFENLFVSPKNFFWSASEKYVVIHNIDLYANEGSTGITVINVQSGQFIEIGKDQIINEQDLGNRDKLNIYNIVWLSDTKFSLIASAGYLGYSGHPGINYNRWAALGDKFNNKDDIVLVANWEVEIVNDKSEPIVPISIEESEIENILIGKWQDSNDKDRTLTFSKEEMIFTTNGVITEREEYGFSDLYKNIYLESDDTYWDITLTYLDQYNLTLYNNYRGLQLEFVR